MSYVVPPAAITRLSVFGSHDSFPVRRVYCVGRNYAAHAREMGFDPDREPPFFFCKPADAVVPVSEGQTLELAYPAETSNYHYEVELVTVIGTAGRNIELQDALKHVWGYAVGLDMTRRDLQMKMREMGRPWEIGKSFDYSAPIGPVHKAASFGEPSAAAIWLKVNGEDKQRSDIKHLIWTVGETITWLSRYFELHAGDVIMTGTPEGVGPVKPGDVMTGGIDRLGEIKVRVI